MKSLGKYAALLLAASLFFVTTPPTFGAVNVKVIEKFKFSTGDEFPKVPLSLSVTEDGLIIIPDILSGDVKIYENVGDALKLIKTLGRKGFGIDEFIRPAYCFYDKDSGKFGLIDYGKAEIVIYDRIGRLEFRHTYSASCPYKGHDIQLINGNIILVSGYKLDQNGKPYDLYYYRLNDLPSDLQQDKQDNLADVQPTFLLPSYLKYDLNNPQEYTTKLLVEDEITSIGTEGWFDVQGESIYFVWEGDLRILKMNINSMERPIVFGQKTPRYIKPSFSEEVLNVRRSGDRKKFQSEMDRKSYIRNLFANQKFVIVVLEGPGKSNLWLQFYSLDGDLLKEEPLPGQPGPGWVMAFDKDNDILYSLSLKENNDAYFLKYKISE